MPTRRLAVETAYLNDPGRALARLDPDTSLALSLEPGDLIKIEGNDTTGAIFWRSDRPDWNTETVRLDRFTRQNADIDLDECVDIRPVEEMAAVSLTLRLPEGTPVPVQFDADGEEMVKRHLRHRPVVERDIVPIMANADYSSSDAPVHAISLIAVATDPHGVVRITDETTVTIQQEAE
jgi:transitional endoplasmic reticulum ATPase